MSSSSYQKCTNISPCSFPDQTVPLHHSLLRFLLSLKSPMIILISVGLWTWWYSVVVRRTVQHLCPVYPPLEYIPEYISVCFPCVALLLFLIRVLGFWHTFSVSSAFIHSPLLGHIVSLIPIMSIFNLFISFVTVASLSAGYNMRTFHVAILFINFTVSSRGILRTLWWFNIYPGLRVRLFSCEIKVESMNALRNLLSILVVIVGSRYFQTCI